MMYQIVEVQAFTEKLTEGRYKHLYKKIHDYVYPILKQNPFFGPNIKKMQGKYRHFYRYRIGDYRLFCRVFQEKVIVVIVDIEPRKTAYR